MEIRIPGQYNQLDYSFKQICLSRLKSEISSQLRDQSVLSVFLAEDDLTCRPLHIHDPSLPVCRTKALRRIQSLWEDIQLWGTVMGTHGKGLGNATRPGRDGAHPDRRAFRKTQAGLTQICWAMPSSLLFFSYFNYVFDSSGFQVFWDDSGRLERSKKTTEL